MKRSWRHYRFDELPLSDLGNGFFGGNLVASDGFEMTLIEGGEGAGHGFHRHEDLDEILVFMDGACTFNVSGTELNLEGGSMIHIPAGWDHQVRYRGRSRVLRIKMPKPRA